MKNVWRACLMMWAGGALAVGAQAADPTEAVSAALEGSAANEPSAWQPGKFVWADLFTTDPAAAEAFYTGLFGWTSSAAGAGAETYIVLSKDDEPVAGIVRHPTRKPGARKARWVLYASVDDLPDAVARATAAGARVLLKPRAVAGRGVQAVVADPQRAVVGLIHLERGDPPDYAAAYGEWNWATLLARDPAAAKDFYGRVFGYDVVLDDRTPRANDYLLASGGYARGSLQPLPDRAEARATWVGFVRVADVDTAVARANASGGRTLLAPKEPRPGLRIAVIADPTGGTVGLVQVNAFESDGPEEEAAP